MSAPQPGIFDESSNQFYFLEYQLNENVSLNDIKTVLSKVLKMQNEVNTVIAFGKTLLNRLEHDTHILEIKNFETLNGINDFHAQGTQRDVLFWIHSNEIAKNFDTAMMINKLIQNIATTALDLTGFTYHDDRDLIGFVDGSANPKVPEQHQVALLPQDHKYAGGSYVLTQKWCHNLPAFNHMPITEQEQVIGRTKHDSIELEGDDMPLNSHVSRTDVSINGKAMKIYRRSAPFGNTIEHGLYFLSFACEMQRFTSQLNHMFGLTDDGLHDRLIEFSTAKTGSYWFAPSVKDLNRLVEIN
ncbi:Dyp-type peroxidase [Pseudoalteromonas denitrificans]|uniref:Putative iron-dependent peroxidase n=1 Tax=Pseudoalteromonas denitrificans DSM 6059 TaxID=1123010 RepID=A0A1I1H4N9_9GAMM|nr:Dyp-type peroxidase [Pseudoalteromonas denitrificans]SFC16393.1 putative iron-dependent peroxidase [Pseudoalteromonas denitrificans DSM 6059]